MILGAGIQGLRDDDGAYDDAYQRAREQGKASAGAEQPERAATVAKLRGRENIDIGEVCLEPAPDGFDVGAGSDTHEKIRRLVRRYSGVGPPPIQRGEDVRRGRERTDAVGDRLHLDFVPANLGAVTDAADAEPIEVGSVDRDGAGNRKRIEAAFNQIPGQQSVRSQIRSDDEYGGRSALRYPPVGIADDDGSGLRHAVDR